MNYIDSDNVVIEGNRRLTCLLLLDEKLKNGELDEEGLPRDQFEEVECKLIPELKEKEQVRDFFLATIHVKGIGMGKATIQRNVWVYSGKFKNHKDIRRLSEILDDDESRHELEKSNMENAISVLIAKNPELVDKDFKKINDTIDVLKDISRSKLNDIVSNPEKIKLLNSLEAELKNLMLDIETKRDALKKK